MDEMRQIIVHPATWNWLEGELSTRGIALARMPDMEDDLPTYVMVPIMEEPSV